MLRSFTQFGSICSFSLSFRYMSEEDSEYFDSDSDFTTFNLKDPFTKSINNN